jgi:hypothetical protein
MHGMQAAWAAAEFKCIHNGPGNEFLFRIILDKVPSAGMTHLLS